MWNKKDDSMLEMLLSVHHKAERQEALSILKDYTKEEAIERCNNAIEREVKLLNGIPAENVDVIEKHEDAMTYWHWVKYLCETWEEE